MKLHWSPRSPFVRKVMITLHEKGLIDRVETVRTPVATTQPNATLMADNPLSKIPTLVLDDGFPLFDSAVICEYLDGLDGAPTLAPASGVGRWRVLQRQALADGLMDVLLLWRQERDREVPSPAHLAAFEVKANATLDAFERQASAFEAFDLGHVALGTALSYLDFRFPDVAWRDVRPALSAWHETFRQRPSAIATEVVNDG